MRTSRYTWPFPIHIEENELTPKHEAETVTINGKTVPKLVNKESVERIQDQYKAYWSQQAAESYKNYSSN